MKWVRFPSLSPSLQNLLITVSSVLACFMLLPMHLPGTQIAGVGANWPLIWVVSWSIRRDPLQGILAGLVLGTLMDAFTSAHPSHILGLIMAGVLTALLQKQRYIQEDFISVALIAFGMAVLVETITALQLTLMAADFAGLPWSASPVAPDRALSAREEAEIFKLLQESQVKLVAFDKTAQTIAEIWTQHQRIALSSAIVSSLWAPIVSYPLNRWWDWIAQAEKS